MTRLLRFLVVVLLTSSAGVAQAVVEKMIHFSSAPDGCQVILKQGLKEIELGTTPLDASIKFRSESSVVRLAFRQTGFQEALIEVTPDRSDVHASLDPVSIFIDEQSYENLMLAKFQNALEDPVTQHLLSDLSKAQRYTHHDKIYLREVGDAIGIVFNLQVVSLSNDLNEYSPEGDAEKMWIDLSEAFSDTINYVLSIGDIDSVQFNINANTNRAQLQVRSSVTRRTIMKWVGGYEYSPGTGTNVYNPFHHQVPVVIEDVVQDGLQKVEDRSSLKYEIMADAVHGNIADSSYERIRVRQYDQKGKLVLSRN